MTWFSFHPGDFAVAFLSVLLEGIPFLLLGSVISGLVDAFVAPERLARMLPKNPVAAICMSGLLGLIFPMCECGSVVVIRRFLRKGLPVGCAVTYMLGAPIVSPIVALSTFAAFKGQQPLEMTVLRLGVGFLLAVCVGLIFQKLPVSSLLQPGVAEPPPVPAPARGGLKIASVPDGSGETADLSATGNFWMKLWRDARSDRTNLLDVAVFFIIGAANAPGRFWMKLQRAVYSACTDFLDVAVFFIIGAAITSLLGTAVDRTVLAPLAASPLAAIVSLMLVAVALALCSTTDAFIAATSFPAFPMTAKLAFLLFGPMFDLKLYWLYGLLFKRRAVVLLALGLFAAVALICWRLAALGF